MQEINIRDDYIKLFQLLKYASLVPSGGEAKFVIDEGLVKVNGKIEKQRGKKIYKKDVIEFEGEKVVIR